MTQTNLNIVTDHDHGAIADSLKKAGASTLHITNGTYAYEAEKLVPTTLTGFQRLQDLNILKPGDAIVVAVNSDQSMKDYVKNVENPDSETERALKVVEPLALQFPNNPVFAVFYDEATPTPLYDHLSQEEGLATETLHKWGGYGIGPDAPKIEGAEFFSRVTAFPFYNKDVKPVCFDTTTVEDQTDVVVVDNVHAEKGPHGKPYLTPDNKILFPLNDPSLQVYAASEQPVIPAQTLNPSNDLK